MPIRCPPPWYCWRKGKFYFRRRTQPANALQSERASATLVRTTNVNFSFSFVLRIFQFCPHLDPPCPQVLAYLLRLRWVYRLCPRKFLQVRLSLRVLRFGLYSALFLLILCSLLYPVFLSGADAVSRLRKETNRIGVSWHRHLWLLSAFRAPNQGRSGKGVM